MSCTVLSEAVVKNKGDKDKIGGKIGVTPEESVQYSFGYYSQIQSQPAAEVVGAEKTEKTTVLKEKAKAKRQTKTP